MVWWWLRTRRYEGAKTENTNESQIPTRGGWTLTEIASRTVLVVEFQEQETQALSAIHITKVYTQGSGHEYNRHPHTLMGGSLQQETVLTSESTPSRSL